MTYHCPHVRHALTNYVGVIIIIINIRSEQIILESCSVLIITLKFVPIILNLKMWLGQLGCGFSSIYMHSLTKCLKRKIIPLKLTRHTGGKKPTNYSSTVAITMFSYKLITEFLLLCPQQPVLSVSFSFACVNYMIKFVPGNHGSI